MPGRKTSSRVAIVFALVAVLVGATACSSSSASSKKVAIVGYSVPKGAYDALSKAFQKTSAGKNVKFSSSYGPSGSQSKAVASGQPADYVAFSLEPDVTRLVPKQVATSWNANATKGMVSDSVVVIAVRKGNPKHINGWSDLARSGIKIVTPDPQSSGSAKWNILAAYESVIAAGGNDAAATDYLKKFYANIVSKPTSGATATTTFLAGTGDVLISYENEAIAARQKGAKIDYIVPDESVLIENPAAVTVKAPSAAKKFLDFVLSTAGQKIFAGKGFRPVVPGVDAGKVDGANDPSAPFPTVKHLVTIASLGGWSTVNDKYFGDGGIVTKIFSAG